MDYPQVKRLDFTEDYHGQEVADPYRYMEDPDDPETKRFVDENNKLVDHYLNQEFVDQFSAKLESLLDYNKFYVPVKRGTRLFFAKQKPKQLQPVIYMREHDKEQIVLDINTLSEDGTTGSVVQSYSYDGKYMAAYITEQGSDWQSILVKNIDDNEDMEQLTWVTLGSIAWNSDSTGFYYNKFPDQTGLSPEEQRRDSKLYFHELGTSQEDDILIFNPDDIEEGPYPTAFDEGKYLFVSLGNSTLPENRLMFRQEGEKEFTWLVDEYDGSLYNPIGVIDDYIYLLTSNQADNNRLVRISIAELSQDKWEEIIPEKDHVLRIAKLVNNKLVLVYEENVKHVLRVYSLTGKFDHQIEMPTFGQLASGSYNASLTGKIDDPEIFFGFTSFLQPMTVYQYNIETEQISKFLSPEIDIEMTDINIDQVFYESKDGTRVPMYLIYKGKLKRDGKRPTYLYGYGGFNVSILPGFSSQTYAWVDDGGLYAVANLRGGGEFGKKWHEQALLGNKQNVFDDFIGAAEYLINQGYTSTPHLGINGRSNGGLLVGATLIQRPDLFGAAIPQVGVLDMLRFPNQKDAGRYWVGEYGNAKENKEHFEFLIDYSPYHNVKSGISYPPTLVTAAEGDDRVAPAHSKKFGAALQYAQSGDAPILVRIETKAGHGYGKPLSKIIQDTAINLAFFKQTLMS